MTGLATAESGANLIILILVWLSKEQVEGLVARMKFEDAALYVHGVRWAEAARPPLHRHFLAPRRKSVQGGLLLRRVRARQLAWPRLRVREYLTDRALYRERGRRLNSIRLESYRPLTPEAAWGKMNCVWRQGNNGRQASLDLCWAGKPQ